MASSGPCAIPVETPSSGLLGPADSGIGALVALVGVAEP